ncbi:MAG TPA: ABC transporter permease subunit [Kribbella sp.]|nr:ABC transporter permease subunit [Kribbella sp.]
MRVQPPAAVTLAVHSIGIAERDRGIGPWLMSGVIGLVTIAGVCLIHQTHTTVPLAPHRPLPTAASASGINGSPWIGFKYVEQFIHSYQFWPVLWNTLVLNIYGLIALFPLPIVLALLLNSLRAPRFSRIVQLITYAPYFISTVVVVGIIIMLFSPTTGVVNNMISGITGHTVNFLGVGWFRHTFVWSGAWQMVGYSAIIYLAALAGISPELHEAARVDGASILRRSWHIDLPGILPVSITLLILNMGQLLSVGFEKVLLMQSPLNQSVSQVIDTYSFQVAFASAIPQYSYATAIGLFKSVISLILVLVANSLARRVAKQSLF